MGLQIGVDAWGPGVSMVHLAGDVDVYTSPALRNTLIDLEGRGSRVLLVDLNDVDFIQATGMGVLLGAAKRPAGRAEPGGDRAGPRWISGVDMPAGKILVTL